MHAKELAKAATRARRRRIQRQEADVGAIHDRHRDVGHTFARMCAESVDGGQVGGLQAPRRRVGAPDADVARWQDRIEPVWKRIAGNCHLTRPIGAALRARCRHVSLSHEVSPEAREYERTNS